jgi:glycosyltransferase involved in cell wall biosynthesis
MNSTTTDRQRGVKSEGGSKGARLPRLAVVISHPIQHFVPLFVRLAASGEVELKVFYCCDWGVREYRDPGFGKSFAWDIPMLEGYEHEFLPIPRRPESLSFFQIDNPDVAQRLAAFGPDAVWVHGYSHRTSWRALKWARGRAKVLYFGDSELLSHRGWKAKALKRLIVPRYFRRCDGFLTIGDNNEAYYRHYGVEDRKMFRGSFPIDLYRFRSAITGLTPADRAKVREKLGLTPDAVVALFVGKLIDIKRPFDFVEAIASLRDVVPRIEGLIVGSGPLENEVRERVRALGVEDRVRFSGFVNQSDIPMTLWAGDMIAMCSSKDPHPLAVSESMAVGNAVVASDRVGCVGPTDAARPGVNAVVYPCGDVAQLAGRLKALAEDSPRLAAMQKASWELAETQDVAAAARGVLRFLQAAV